MANRQTFLAASVIAGLGPILAVVGQSASASVYTWDPAGALGGSGTWDVAVNSDWWNGAGAILWSDTSASGVNTAVFRGTAGTVTLNANLSASGLIFNTPGYLLRGSHTLTLGSGGINGSAATSGTTTIASALSLQGGQSWQLGSGATLSATGAITRNLGATLDFSTNGLFAGAGLSTVLGNSTNGWATSGGSTWAFYSAAGQVVALASYNNDTWSSTKSTTVTLANNTAYANATTISLRFNNSAADTVSLSGTDVITSGGILVTGNVGANASTITGGVLEGASGRDLVVIQNNAANGLTIGSVIANNTSATALTKSGPGLLTFAAANTYSGGTLVNGGTLQLGDGAANNGSVAGNITNNSAVVFANPTAQNFGGTISGGGALAKTGAGILTIAASQNYSGPTIINGGTVRLNPVSAASLAGFGANTTGSNGSNSTWTVNTSAVSATAITNGTLTLTDGNMGEARSAFFNTPVAVNTPFTTSFTYVPTVGSGSQNGLLADGFCFVLQNDSRGPAALGGPGGSLGYGAGGTGQINNSFAMELNIFSYGGGPTQGTYFGTNGAVNPETTPVSVSSGDTVKFTLSYNGTTFVEQMTDVTSGLSYSASDTVNLSSVVGGNTAYLGFTGATGGSFATQTISSFSGSFAISGGTSNNVNILPAGSPVYVTGGTLDATSAPQAISSLAVGSSGALNLSIGNLLACSGSAGFAPGSTLNISGSIAALPELLMTCLGMPSGAFSNVTLSGSSLVSVGDSLSYSSGSLEIVSGVSARWTAGSGNWSAGTNWDIGLPPNGTGQAALLNQSSGTVAVNLDLPITLGGLDFGASGSTAVYSLSGSTLTFANSGGTSSVTVLSGSQSIHSAVYLSGGSLDFSASNRGILSISGNISDDNGPESLIVDGDGTGRLILSGKNTFHGGVHVDAGTLMVQSAFALPDGSSLTVGRAAAPLFAPVDNASLEAVSVPEPGPLAMLLAALAIAMAGYWGRRKSKITNNGKEIRNNK
jgi:fibronectin-binding autotransporter adhesin